MDTFTALADPNRRKIVELLAERGKLSAGEICAEFDTSAPAVSQHLKVLKEAEVLQMEKLAQKRIYSINPTALNDLESWVNELKSYWQSRFDALDLLLQSPEIEPDKELIQKNEPKDKTSR